MQRRKGGPAACKAGAAGLLMLVIMALDQGAWAGPRSIDALINDTVARVGQSQARKHGKFALPTQQIETEVPLTPLIDSEPTFVWAEAVESPMPQEEWPVGVESDAVELLAPIVLDRVPLAEVSNSPIVTEVNPEVSLPVAEDAVANSSAFLTEPLAEAEPVSAAETRPRDAPLYVGAGSPVFPEGIQYVLQGQRLLQYQRNPYRLSEFNSDDIRSDTSINDEIRAAAIFPLLSERTVGYGSLAFGNVRYQDLKELDHSPHHLEGGVRWRAGWGGEGSFSVADRRQLYRFLSRSWPARDMLNQQSWAADVGLRVTENLTLPQLSVMQRRLRHETSINQQLFNRNEETYQLAGRWVGMGDSYIQVGGSYSSSSYPDRTESMTASLGDRYNDYEAFLRWRWRYSVKTVVEGRLGYLSRQYPSLAERDVNIFLTELNLGWSYSPKTQIWLTAWQLPYGNEENPSYLYSTIKGVRGGVQWAWSDRLWASLNVVREYQENHAIVAAGRDASHTWRLGPRFEWNLHRNVKLVLDAWHERVFKGHASQNLRNNVVRLGVVINLDNGSQATQKLFRHADCDPPRYVELSECLPLR